MLTPLLILSQIEHTHPFLQNGFFYVALVLFILFIVNTTLMLNALRKKTKYNDLTQRQHAARIDSIRKEHMDTMEKMRQEMLKREEEHGRLWHESEKEVINVLNGVSNLLELNEKLGQIETDKLLGLLNDIRNKLNNMVTKE